ncbi:MAG: efflux RND transporter periplasmic adaptor subunit, partial [Gemmatimonadota bacterium]|nr:efflux RND transporter periplasmic adaptor subunit [Gemmatimonadota bacterium]
MSTPRERPRKKGSREPHILPEGERDRPGRRIEIGAGGGQGMDVKRSVEGRKKRRNIYIGVGALALIAITVWLSQLEPAAQSVDRDIQLFGTVQRGSFVREVRGPGTLVPEQMVFVSAVTGGRVEQVLVQPGQAVVDTTVLVILSNPDVELEHLQAQQQLTQARAGLLELERTLTNSIAGQEAALAAAEAELLDARREAEAFEELVENGTVSRMEASRARERLATAQVAFRTEQTRHEALTSTVENQLAIQREQVNRLQSIVEFRQLRVNSMRVRAGASGEIQDFDLEVGQWVMPGTTLTRVAQPGQLMAELRIPETQARDVQVGQPAMIDTRTDSIAGAVRRVDPNVQNSSVLVEVRLTEALPPGARPQLSVDGTIELERLEDVLYVARPTYGQANAQVSLFKLTDDGNEAVRVTVRLGRSSVNEIEVLEGLEEGDVIILSDLSRVQDAD